ncbi:MAG: hypothetical protein KatS3mg068_0137 [Candidatus Sericytochromatia bacterium]|nr:MAG: hypothetical protein KatS3mg068_0137 [Candidatus Sericytochromatia bacterium]
MKQCAVYALVGVDYNANKKIIGFNNRELSRNLKSIDKMFLGFLYTLYKLLFFFKAFSKTFKPTSKRLFILEPSNPVTKPNKSYVNPDFKLNNTNNNKSSFIIDLFFADL